MPIDRVIFVKACVLCGRPVERQGRSALLSVRSRTSGRKTFTAHVECLREALRSEYRHALDLGDVPPDAEDIPLPD